MGRRQADLSEQAVNAFRVMRANGINPSVLVLNLWINAFGEDRQDVEAFGVLQYMKDNLLDLKPDVVTYTTLMKALIRTEKFEKVLLSSSIVTYIISDSFQKKEFLSMVESSAPLPSIVASIM
ncbi:pentatricopeptide repeat-containing protein At5g42310, chloroplastic-like isoform X1 [Magnolia sinica]|uniref:pentatricopeptide repeat-containing protein At5g42310, chloroplastic-like isoform X1 n=1 Tax=Magnolia sinica TaxID=86752 RepID=UPI00265925F5|nr:pentatricopeptide repeat-containing protein At5g42310, chloroplastic-like isoform X1 [Magnolia sinica]XP_058105125.1 pentatricopeptide repeat-containing protein At5g42310, chloroplastic-like isoform X1 [Magnolia sinica]